MANYVESKEIGLLSYKIEKKGGKYRLWLNGCGIGRPRPDKPAGETWEWSTTSLPIARKEMIKDAQERLQVRIDEAEAELSSLRNALVSLGKVNRSSQ